MLNNEELKVVIIMMRRASCSGEESVSVATVLMKLEALFNAQAQVQEQEANKSPIPETVNEGKPKKKARGK